MELLPAALGIKNGDVKMIKNAGGMITNPFDSAVRSLLIGIIELGVEEVMVIGHTDCGVNFEEWLRGFDSLEGSVQETVDFLRSHPLIPKDVTIRGFVIDTETGKLTPLQENA